MAAQEFKLTASDGLELFCYKIIPKKVDAVLLILHGSIEHAKRYFDLGEYLEKDGIAVYTFDQRGHGQTAADDKDVAYFSDKPKGWYQSIDDIVKMVSLIRKEQPGKTLTVFGHSMGSFLLRTLMALHPNSLDKAIICGTADTPKVLLGFGRMLSGVTAAFMGRRHRSKMIHGLVYGALNSRINDPRTPYDFITSDEKIVDQYIADPRCGNLVTVEYAKEMLRGLDFIGRESTYAMVKKDLPVFIVSGAEDPLAGTNRADFDRVVIGYKTAGLTDLTVKVYPAMRHEIINEIGKEEVYEDIKNFVLK